LIRAARQQITREWWETRRSDFDVFVSQVVIREVSAGDKTAAEERLKLLENIAILELSEDATQLAEELLRRVPLPANAGKALHVLRSGIHLVIVDLFPPSVRDPQGVHKAIWDELIDNDFTLPSDKTLTLASYIGGLILESFVEPVAVGASLPDMPLFLTPEVYIPLPLERTYESAWEAVPDFWRDVLTSPA
jgi:hypothetical protein